MATLILLFTFSYYYISPRYDGEKIAILDSLEVVIESLFTTGVAIDQREASEVTMLLFDIVGVSGALLLFFALVLVFIWVNEMYRESQ